MLRKDLENFITFLVVEHDNHMDQAYDNFTSGEDVEAMWAYGAGLQHAIRRIQSFVDDWYQ